MLVLVFLAAAITLYAQGITLNTNTDALSVPGQTGIDALQNGSNRDVILAITSDDLQHRNAVAHKMVATLLPNPLVEDVRLSPQVPSEEFQDWIWAHRFHLAPPTEQDFEPANMTGHLTEAKAAFATIDSMLLGDRMLLDPTGSYKTLIDRFENTADSLPTQDGVWQSQDNTAAILHLRLMDRAFDAGALNDLANTIRQLATDNGTSAHILGVRTIAAETTVFNTNASTRTSALAGGLLLLWLVWSLRSLRAVLYAVFPLGLGICVALLTVNLMFGSVHVIALAFGGVLSGLALDYPVHVMGHAARVRPQALRLIFLGAVTTGMSFLAMTGSQVPALVQTGVFVLVGLTVSALATVLLPSPQTVNLRGTSFAALSFRLPYKPLIEYALIAVGLITVIVFNKPPPITLFQPPAHVLTEIQNMGDKLNLPSKKYAVVVRGRSLQDLLANERSLQTTLDLAIQNGQLTSYSMLAQQLSPGRAHTLSATDFRQHARVALTQAGMSVAFADQQTQAYEQAIGLPPIRQTDLQRFAETQAMAQRINVSETGWQETVDLTFPKNTSHPTFLINTPNAELINRLEPVQKTLNTLRTRMATWLMVGLVCGVVILALGLRDWKQALRIFRTSCAVLGASACILLITYGAINMFQMIAMVLVVGIGVDYNLILTGIRTNNNETATASVFICATTTLIAFFVLSLSQVQVLHQMGAAVLIGLVVMLCLTLSKSGAAE